MVVVVMGIEDKVEFPASGIECSMDGFDFRGIDRRCEAAIGIVDQVAVVIGKARKLVDFKAAHRLIPFGDR